MSPVSAPPATGYPYLDTICEQPGSVIAMAHRGGAAHPELPGVENTVHAFGHAAALGYRYLETDVHATADGVLLAFHDRSLDRVTSSTGAIARLRAADLSSVLIGGEHPVPSMAGLLEAFPECRFNIDIKSEAAVQPLAELIEATRSEDRVCVGSFSQRRLDSFRRASSGRVATSATPAEVAAFRMLPGSRLARALARRPAALQVPHRHGRLRVVTRELVRRAHAAGVHVHVWTVDEPAEMHHLLDLGVDGLITDRTDLLKDVLLERGQWQQPTGRDGRVRP
ncbi:MAG TPA: glycerophosphodiester phosphodiesterase [Marmoricola sp.]|nr:glycerophosphodiester phosphodiesterase [Marmoricola sp.]